MTRSASSGTRRSTRVYCAIYTRKSSEEGLDAHRLTRSLADFAKIVEILDARGASLSP